MFFGGSSDFRDELTDWLAVFERGFSNSVGAELSVQLLARAPSAGDLILIGGGESGVREEGEDGEREEPDDVEVEPVGQVRPRRR